MRPDMQDAIESYQRIEIYRTKYKLIPYVLGSAAFVAMGVAILLYANRTLGFIIEPIAILFFGFSMYFWLREWLRTRPILVIDEQGILDDGSTLMSASRRIQWQEIDCVDTMVVKNQTQICIQLHDQIAYLKQLSGWAKVLMALNKKMGYDGVYVNTHATPYAAEEVAGILEHYRQHFSGSLKESPS